MTPAVQIHRIGTVSAKTIDDIPTITLSTCVSAPARALNACSSDSPSAFRLLLKSTMQKSGTGRPAAARAQAFSSIAAAIMLPDTSLAREILFSTTHGHDRNGGRAHL